jgi:UDPglucose 6-dehydrogenase
VINTEWSEFRNPDFDQVKSRMKGRVLFDGRNLYDPQLLRESGFSYYSIGRPLSKPGDANVLSGIELSVVPTAVSH